MLFINSIIIFNKAVNKVAFLIKLYLNKVKTDTYYSNQ